MTILADINDYRTDRQFVRRYLSVATREAVFSGQVGTVSKDTATNGIYRFTYTGSSGSTANTRTHMTIDIGTSAGARDLGTFRIRKPADGTYVYIEEVSEQESGIVNGVYFTIRRDFRPVSVKPRIVTTQVNASYINGFTEYHDYDTAYSVQNDDIKPKANITQSGTYSNGTLIQAKPAGFVDSGQVFRTVNLSSSNSIAIAPGASISSRLWDVRDGTITVGTTSSTAITVRFPVGFRWISLTVTDSNGVTDIMYFPIWVHDNSNMPIAKVKRESDSSEEWRDMSFSFWGNDNEFVESVLPEGACICYWEVAEFDNASSPNEYLGQAILFVRQETEALKLYEAGMTLEASGIGYWLSQARSYGQKLYSKVSPTAWYEIVSLTVQRAVHYVLREYSTALTICNFFPKMTSNAVEAENIPENNVWDQIKYLVAGDEFREVRSDSLGGIWVTKPADLMNSTERSSWLVTCGIDTQDISGDSPISYPNEFVQKVSLTKGSGFSYNGTTNTVYMCQAPGKAEGYAPSTDEAPALRLGTSNPQGQLNQLVGDWWARQNNPQPQIELELFYNFDFAEPAYGEVIELTYSHDSLKGTALTDLPCRLIRVTRSDDDESGNGKVNWSLAPITDGDDADYVEVPPPVEYNEPDWNLPIENIFPDSYIPPPFTDVASPIFPPPPVPPTPYNPDPIFYVAAVTSDKKILITANFTNESPTWTSSTLTMNGNIVQAQVDPFSPFYLGTGTAINIVVVTTERIYTVDDIYNAQTVTSRYTFTDISPLRSLSISQGFEKNAVVTSLYDDRTTITTSTNLTSWSAEVQYGTTGLDICFDLDVFSISVPSNIGGNGSNSGISVNVGDFISWDATGTWDINGGGVGGVVGPDGSGVVAGAGFTCPTCQRHALIGRIGVSGAYFDMGSSGFHVATQSGNLHMLCNDGNYLDNIGSINVTVSKQVDCTSGDLPPLENSPGAYVSSKSDGRVYASSADSGIGFISANNGALMESVFTVTPTRNIDGFDALIGDIGVPQKGNTGAEIIGFYGRSDNRVRQLIRFSGINDTDVSPIASGMKYGPYKSQQISCHPNQSGKIICAGINYSRTRVGVWESVNNGGDWLVVQAPVADSGTGRYERAVYASVSSQVMYLWGTKGKIGLGRKSTAWTIDSKVGNINQATTGEIINIFVAGTGTV